MIYLTYAAIGYMIYYFLDVNIRLKNMEKSRDYWKKATLKILYTDRRYDNE